MCMSIMNLLKFLGQLPKSLVFYISGRRISDLDNAVVLLKSLNVVEQLLCFRALRFCFEYKFHIRGF